jgi:hypothetical protein
MQRPPSTPLVLLTGWLVPGGSHFLLGQRQKALVFFLAITLTFVGGMALADFTNISPERHGYYFFAHVLNAGETLIAMALTTGIAEDHVPRHFGMVTGEVGMLYSAIAAILNLIVLMDAYGIILRQQEEETVAEGEAEGVAEGESA